MFEGNWNERFLLRHASESAYILLFDYTSTMPLSTLGGYIGRFVIEKDMPFYCVAANCTNKVCLKDGISLHNIPYFKTNTRKLKDEEKYGLILYAQSVCLCRQRLRLYARIIVEQRITRGNFFRCRGSASLTI